MYKISEKVMNIIKEVMENWRRNCSGRPNPNKGKNPRKHLQWKLSLTPVTPYSHDATQTRT